MEFVKEFDNYIKYYAGINNHKDCTSNDIKLIFLAEILFGIETDDSTLSLKFGKDILEVINVIKKGLNFDYIKSEDNYKKYIIVANILSKLDWIEWGTSIRGAWFNECGEYNFVNGGICYVDNISFDELDDFIKYFNF